MNSAKRLQTPFNEPKVYLIRSWRTTAKGSLVATLKTPDGLYALVAFETRGGWNAACFGEGFQQYAVGSAEPPLTYEDAATSLYNFCLDMVSHYDQTYATSHKKTR